MRFRSRNPSGEPKAIETLFDKYKKILRAPQESVISVFCGVVEREFGFSIQKEYVDYNPHTKTIYIKKVGPIKNEILLYKDKILEGCKEELGEKSAPSSIV